MHIVFAQDLLDGLDAGLNWAQILSSPKYRSVKGKTLKVNRDIQDGKVCSVQM
jgi:hypothetical protein